MLHFKESSCASHCSGQFEKWPTVGIFICDMNHSSVALFQCSLCMTSNQNFANSLRLQPRVENICVFTTADILGGFWMRLIIMARKEDVFPVGRHPSGWFSSYLFFRFWLSLATMQTINVSSGPRVTWPLVSVTPGAGGHTPGPRGVATDLGMESFDFHQLGTWDLSKGIWEEELDINLVWSLVTAGGASWTLHSTVSTGIWECLH